MARSNCLLFAVWMWARRPDSYIAMRRSHYYPGPHFLWAKRYRDGRVKFVSFVPDDDDKRVWPIFSGHLKRGDAAAREVL